MLSRFHEALATTVDERQFAHVPVDWWDAAAGLWRPTAIERTCEGNLNWRDNAEILVPLSEGIERGLALTIVRIVRIVDLRPSQLIDERIAHFFTTRYTLELLDTLTPCIERVGADEQGQLRRVSSELVEVNRSGFSAWVRAYLGGSDAHEVSGEVAADTLWAERAVEGSRIPAHLERFRGAPDGLFTAIEETREAGEIRCSPVAMWDELAGRWRPTIMLNATGEDAQFLAGRDDQVLVPGDPVDVALVPGSLLQPIDLADTCFSLLAIPVLARDFLRMQDALAAAGMSHAAVAAHPSMVAFSRMLQGAAEEWRGVYEEGLLGPAPEPRVAPLAPELWGFTSDASPAWGLEDGRP